MILYRGEIENNKFIYGHPYQENGEDFIISKGVITNKVITNSLMPYTGWKDKNGAKIFQSDTIKGFITKGEKTQEFIYQVVCKYIKVNSFRIQINSNPAFFPITGFCHSLF